MNGEGDNVNECGGAGTLYNPFKGTLQIGTDADFIMLDNDLNVINTYIAGECVFQSDCIKK